MIVKVCLLFICIIVTNPEFISATNPGLKTRITQAGLNYANTVALNMLCQKVAGQAIPDQHGSSGHVSYDVTNTRIKNFVKPQSSITLNSPTGLRWRATGTGLSLNGDLHYKYKKGWIKLSGHVGFDVSVNGLSFNLAIKIGSDSQGKPTIAANGCSCSIDSVKVKFHKGIAAWILNLFKGKIGKKIKDVLQGKMCNIINNAVNTDGEKAIQKIKVETKIGKKFLLDYRLVSNPLFTSSYMETYHKGEMFWASSMKEAPIPVPPLPHVPDTQKMFYLWVSDYVFNTFAYEGHIHGKLTYNLTAKDLPEDKKGALNTTCLKPLCIGNLIPQIGKKYPHRQVDLRLKTTVAPVMTTENSTIKVLCFGHIDMYATLPNQHPIYMLTLKAAMNATINLSIKDQEIFGKVEKLNFKVSALNSTVGPIDDRALQFVVNSALKLFVEPVLDEFGRNGFPLPTTKNVRFVNTELKLAPHTLIIATDVQYTGDDDTTLRFVPQKEVFLHSEGIPKYRKLYRKYKL